MRRAVNVRLLVASAAMFAAVSVFAGTNPSDARQRQLVHLVRQGERAKQRALHEKEGARARIVAYE